MPKISKRVDKTLIDSVNIGLRSYATFSLVFILFRLWTRTKVLLGNGQLINTIFVSNKATIQVIKEVFKFLDPFNIIDKKKEVLWLSLTMMNFGLFQYVVKRFTSLVEYSINNSSNGTTSKLNNALASKFDTKIIRLKFNIYNILKNKSYKSYLIGFASSLLCTQLLGLPSNYIINAIVIRGLNVFIQYRKWGNTNQTIFYTLSFMTSISQIMWSWFYHPYLLSRYLHFIHFRTYTKWIEAIAGVDNRLLAAVRLFSENKIKYGVDTGYSYVMGDYATELGLPYILGDPKHGQYPCLLVHGGIDGCHNYGIKKFKRAFKMAFKVILNYIF